MIGFEIRINNREPVIITSYDVAFVMVNCNYSFDDNIYIGGTDTLSRLVWVDENLKIGDKVVIKVVEISKVSPPMKVIYDKDKMKIKYEQLKKEEKKQGNLKRYPAGTIIEYNTIERNFYFIGLSK